MHPSTKGLRLWPTNNCQDVILLFLRWTSQKVKLLSLLFILGDEVTFLVFLILFASPHSDAGFPICLLFCCLLPGKICCLLQDYLAHIWYWEHDVLGARWSWCKGIYLWQSFWWGWAGWCPKLLANTQIQNLDLDQSAELWGPLVQILSRYCRCWFPAPSFQRWICQSTYLCQIGCTTQKTND